MTRPADPAPAPRLPRALGAIGVACLALITLVSPSATRMFASPWTLALAAALLAPTLTLALRAFDPRRPLVLPSPAWTVTALVSALVVLASALASPHRGPSLLWSGPLLAALAFFFVACDALQSGELQPSQLARGLGWFFAATVLVSLGIWAASLPGASLAFIRSSRNPHPLGHSNYTAGLAVLALPWLALAAWRARGVARFAWAVVALLALVMLFTSGSRGGLLGLGALALAALVNAPFSLRKKFALALLAAAAGLAFALVHTRTRAMFTRADPAAEPNLSSVQRTAMATAGAHMGLDRPLLGWGSATTPLVYPRYRQWLDGGAENVLQLHSTPIQLWAELGAAGLVCAAAWLWLAVRARSRATLDPSRSAAWIALAGYACFALTDWQLDLPVFGFAVALAAALLAAPAASPPSSRLRSLVGGAVLTSLAVIVFLGHRDPTPELNLRALALAREPATADRAVALLRESLAFNPAQEIAHFNLGWLLVVSDPAAAGKHFLAAAHLVPDKGGVYFGLGLARLNQNQPAPAARAFALECLNDPAFLSSPWWREPAIAALRDLTATEFSSLVARIRPSLRLGTWSATQLDLVTALAAHLGRPATGPERTYRRERTGYPVLMRNLDLPPPTDLYDVRESLPAPTGSLSPLLPISPSSEPSISLPPKGWLRSPLLLRLLDERATAIPKS